MRPAIHAALGGGNALRRGLFRYRGRMRLAIHAAPGGGNALRPDRHARLRLAKPMGTHDLGAIFGGDGNADFFNIGADYFDIGGACGRRSMRLREAGMPSAPIGTRGCASLSRWVPTICTRFGDIFNAMF
ncbi:hypothetical protein C5610_03525 [Idiomarina sp. OT37-5b]|nr:hypothetical protein C5610_03525 [Idiomarina sp. OT37-5b]